MKYLLRLVPLLGFLMITVACSGNSDLANEIERTIVSPTDTPTELELLVKTFANLDENEILLQLDYEPTFSLPRYHYDFGRLPIFTLLADGRLFYVDHQLPDRLPMTVKLTQLETAKLLNDLYMDKVSELESYLDQCQDQPDGSHTCIADAAYSLLTIRMRDSSLKTIKNYAGFANQPLVLENTIQQLSTFTHPSAKPYIPEEAALFLTGVHGEMEIQPLNYPLNPPHAPSQLQEGENWAVELQPPQIYEYLYATDENIGPEYFTYNDQLILAEMVPWLPGNDFSAKMMNIFPPNLMEKSEQHRLNTCPLIPVTELAEGTIRLVYVDNRDLFVQDGNSEPMQLNQAGIVMGFVLSPDHSIAYFSLDNGQEIALWGANLFTGESFPIIQDFQSAKGLTLHNVSDDNEWLPLTIKTDDQHGSLWVVRTNGENLNEISNQEELIALQPVESQSGAVPYNVKWVPDTHLLVYDAYPVVENIFIYIPNNMVVDVDSGEKNDYPPGNLIFSPDGKQVVAQQIDHLQLANADGSQTHRLIVPYYALGMGEHYLYPPIEWSIDSQYLVVSSPEKPEVNWETFHKTPMIISQVQLENERPYPLYSFTATPVSLVFSPGGLMLAYWTAPFQSNVRSLTIALVDGSEEALYDTKESLNYLTWSRNGSHFLYSYGEQPAYQQVMIANPCGGKKPILEGPYPMAKWLDGYRFILELTNQQRKSSQLILGNPSGETITLAEIMWEIESQWEAVVIP